MPLSNRRQFLAGAAALSAAPSASAAPAAPGSDPQVRLGGPIFLKSDDPAQIAREHRRLGYSAAYCPSVRITETERMKAIETAFAREKVVIAEVGAWVNMLDADPVKRAENLKYVTDRLALADALGALNCVDIAGSYSKEVWYGPHPKNLSKEFFDATVQNCRHVIDAVKPKRAAFTLEMMGWAWPDGPDAYLTLIKAIDRPAFAVHFDICNAINSPQRFYNNTALIQECVKKLGSRIKSCHAKDLQWPAEMNVHFVEVIPGRGSLDYTTLLRELARLPQKPPLMLEHLKTEDEYAEGRKYIVKTAAAAGITVG